MYEEILNDFFNSISKDGKVITLDNLNELEHFMTKSEFDDINEEMHKFLNEFIYWIICRLDYQKQFIDENQINKMAINKIKKHNSDGFNSAGRSNSYQMIYKKNLEFVRIKNSEMRKIYKKVLKNKNVDLKITREIYDEYFADRTNHKGILLKFLTRTQTIIINKHYQVRNSLQNFKNKKSFKNKLGPKIRTQGNKASTKSDDDTTVGRRPFCYNSTNDHKDTNDKSELSKSNPSYLSDNEGVVRNKINFLKVLKSVTTNMLHEIKKEGKPVDIVIEPQALPELDLILSNKESKEKSIHEEEDKTKQVDLQVDEIVINVNEEDKAENKELSVPHENHNFTLSNSIKKEIKTNSVMNPIVTRRNKEKKDCSCKCIIY